MKIIFMGTPAFAVPSLNILIENKYDVVSVVTVPDRKKGRGLQIEFSDVKKAAIENGLNLLQPENLKGEEFISEITYLNPDIIVVVAFRILPSKIFTIPRLGSFNLHASLLPKYRGAAPINHAIMNSEKETGVTTFFLKEKVDTGNIILQEKIIIEDTDNAGTLHDKLSQLGAQLVLKTVKLIENGKVELKLQNEEDASKAPKIYKEDCRIDWNKDAAILNNFIQALSPYPGAFSKLNGKTIKIYSASVTNLDADDSPGTMHFDTGKLLVSAKDKMLELLEIHPEGKRKMAAADFINGLTTQQRNSGKMAFDNS